MSDSESSTPDASDTYQPPRSRGKTQDPLVPRTIQTRSTSSSPSPSSAIDLSGKPSASSKRRSRRKKNVLDFPAIPTEGMPNDASPSPAGSSPVAIPATSRLPAVDLSYSPTNSRPPVALYPRDSVTPSLASLMRAPAESATRQTSERLYTRTASNLDLFLEDLDESIKHYHSPNFSARVLFEDYGLEFGILRNRSEEFQAGLLAVLVRWETPHVEGLWLVSLRKELKTFCAPSSCPDLQAITYRGEDIFALPQDYLLLLGHIVLALHQIINELASLKDDPQGFVFDPEFKSLRALEGSADPYLLKSIWGVMIFRIKKAWQRINNELRTHSIILAQLDTVTPNPPPRVYRSDPEPTSTAPLVLPSITTPHPVQVHFASTAPSTSVYIPGFGQVEDTHGVSSSGPIVSRPLLVQKALRAYNHSSLTLELPPVNALSPTALIFKGRNGSLPLRVTPRSEVIIRLLHAPRIAVSKKKTEVVYPPVPKANVLPTRATNITVPPIPTHLTVQEEMAAAQEVMAAVREETAEALEETVAALEEMEVGQADTEAQGAMEALCTPEDRPGDPDGGDNPPDPPPLGDNLPVPAPRAPLEFRWQFSSKIPYSSLPEWDGKPTTVIQYVSELSYYQLLGDDVTNHLARVAPFRFTGLARTWFNGLTLADRLRCTANMTNFLIFIREQFMHEEWQHDRKLEFDRMYFRKGKDFRYELPVEWVLRRISYARLLYPEEADFEPLVCSRVLAIRPRSWGTYILTEHSQTIRELLERANSEQPRLLYAWERERKEMLENEKTLRSSSSRQQTALLVAGEEDKDTRLSSNHFEFFDSDEDTPEAFAADRKRRVPNRSASNNKQSRIEWPNGKTFEGHAFTRNDSQQSRVKPPGSCHLCTSPLHFYRECAHFPMWVAISKRLREQGKRDPKDLHKLDREYEAHVASLQTDESDDSVSNYSMFESSEYALLVRSSFSAAKMFHADSPVSLNRAYRRCFTRGDENKGKGAVRSSSEPSHAVLDPPPTLTSSFNVQSAGGAPHWDWQQKGTLTPAQ
ncbi:hypothetical protein EYR38_002226 [Pleurotus pulmonarius]|nr:hypothetical protein EYR38_002226 [Pleurotus pulmonarius]